MDDQEPDNVIRLDADGGEQNLQDKADERLFADRAVENPLGLLQSVTDDAEENGLDAVVVVTVDEGGQMVVRGSHDRIVAHFLLSAALQSVVDIGG